jgi:hypothetical protein
VAINIDKWIEENSATSEATPMPQGAQPVAPAQQSFGPVEKYEYQQDVASQYDTIVSGLPNNGRVLQSKSTGEYIYVDKGTSTKDPEVIRKVLSQVEKQVPSGEMVTPRAMREKEIRQELIGQAGLMGALSQKAGEGELFTGGTVDERIAAIAAREGRPYEEVLQDARALSRATQAEYPVSSEVAKLVGMASSLSPMALGKKVLTKAAPAVAGKISDIGKSIQEAPPLARQATTVGGATAGATTEGFVYGLGAGEGGLEGRLAEGGQRAQLGALFAAPISTVITTFGRVREARQAGRAAVNEIAESLGISSGAARLINEAMDDGRTLEETVQALRQAGNQGMIADSTEAAKTLLDTAVNVSGKARDVAAGNIEGRIATQREELAQTMGQALGAPKPRGQTVAETVQARTKTEAGEAYKAARETPIDYASDAGMKIEEVLGRIPSDDIQSAFGLANKLMQSEGKRNQQIMADIAADGTISFREMPNVMQLDYLKRALQAQANDNVNQFGKKTELGQMYDRLALELRDAVGVAVPTYKKGVGLAREGFLDIEAGKIGEQLLSKRVSVDDVIKFTKDASGSEKQAAKLGLRQAINNIIEDAKVGATKPQGVENEAVLKLLRELSSQGNRTKISELLGNDVAGPLFKKLDEVSKGIQLRSTLGGSQTAQRTAGRAGIEEEAAGGVIQNLFMGNPVKFTDRMRNFLTGSDEFISQRRDVIATEIVDVLSGRKGKDAELALKYIKEAQSGAKLSKPKAAIIAKELDKAMYQAIPAVELQRATEGE